MNNFETKTMYSRKLQNVVQYKICGYQVIDKKPYPIIAVSNGNTDLIITHEDNSVIAYGEISKLSFELLADIHIGKFLNGSLNTTEKAGFIFDNRNGNLVERDFDATINRYAERGHSVFFNPLREFYNEVMMEIYEDPISNISWKDPRGNQDKKNVLQEALN